MLKSFLRRRTPVDVAQTMQAASALHQQGKLDDAAPLYLAALEVAPDHFDALHLLGVVKLQQQRFDESLVLIGRALANRPRDGGALSNRGLALHALQRYAEALASFDEALASMPGSADFYFNRGITLHAMGRLQDAIESFDAAIVNKPDHARAHCSRGDCLRALDRNEEALASHRNALEIWPSYPEALCGLGLVSHALHRAPEALAAFDQALAARPGYAAAIVNRANLLAEQAHYEEAIDGYGEVLAAEPLHVDALINRGNALHAIGSDRAALADYELARHLAPGHVEAAYNAGVVLHALGRPDEAIACYDQALAIDSRHVEAVHNRGVVLGELNRHEDAIASFKEVLAIAKDYPNVAGSIAHAQAHLCDWADHDAGVQRVLDGVRLGKPVSVPFPFLSLSFDPAAQRSCAAIHVALRHASRPKPLWTGENYAHDRIRLAYLSANFHDHPVAQLIAGLFEQHDRSRFELTAISFGPDDREAMRARLIASFDRFIDIRQMGDAEAAKLLRTLEIDIAIDLMGFTKDARPGILAHRPAPIQVNYLGYPGTMGADFIDYVLADDFVVPADHRVHYVEKVVALPDCYQVNDSRRTISERTPTRAEAGLPDHAFVFCCFNNSYKITPQVFDVWMRLLRQIDGSVLWLLHANASAEANLRREAQSRGVAPDRLVFAPRLAADAHLARHRLADLFLDTLPYNAHTTASDALWAGLPVLTCVGTTFAGRVAGSLLHAIGLPELATDTLAAYESLALRLAEHPEVLREIREKLARARSTMPLFDTSRFRRHVEAAYVSMVERCRRAEPPEGFAVNIIAAP